MNTVYRKNLLVLLLILFLNAYCIALGVDLTWENIKTNLNINNSSTTLQNNVTGDGSSASVSGTSTLIINSGISLTNAILEVTSSGILNLQGKRADSVIAGSIIAQAGGSVNISGALNLEGATLSGEGNFSNSGTINLTASNLPSSITNKGTINLTGASLTSNILGTGNLNINDDTTISSNIENKINVANTK